MLFRSIVTLALFVASTIAVDTNDTANASPDASADSASTAGFLPCIQPDSRKEWRSLTTTQRKNWLNAVKCLAHTPHDPHLTPTLFPSDIGPVNPSSSLYDDLVYVHMDLNHNIHYTGLFLPFHRWFLNLFETKMRTKCGYTGPMAYWDWTIDAADPYHTTLLNSDPVSGLGTWGGPSDDYTVNDGALGSGSTFRIAYPVSHALRRNFTAQPWPGFPLQYLVTDPNMYAGDAFKASEVNYLVNHFAGDYKGFQSYLDRIQGMHSGPHLMFGADLQGTCPSSAGSGCQSGQAWSPNDPVFFLHHGMIDRVWWLWQKANPANKNAFSGGSVQSLQSAAAFAQYPTGAPPNLNTNTQIPNDGMGTSVKIADVLDTAGHFLCYKYV